MTARLELASPESFDNELALIFFGLTYKERVGRRGQLWERVAEGKTR